MQTFMPLPSFEESLRSLDYKRLGKQRVEAMQIYNVLAGKAKPNKKGNIPWGNHPAVLMWKGYEDALALYHNLAIDIWIEKGYNNTMKCIPVNAGFTFPHWIGNEGFHSSHRAALLHKNYEFYSKYKWKEMPELNYIWVNGKNDSV